MMDELLLAKRDVVDKPYYYEHVFAGKECKPYCGLSLSKSFTRLYGIFDWRSDVATAGAPDEDGLDVCDDWGTWYPSIFDKLESIYKRMLGTGCRASRTTAKAISFALKATPERIRSSSLFSHSLEFESIDCVSSNEQRE
jgi:hypothetical protein